MLPRSQRLNSREFSVVFDNARVLRHPLLQLRFYKHALHVPQDSSGAKAIISASNISASHGKKAKSRNGETRVAFVAPKKLGNAVVRNAIRRRVRERYRILRAEAIRLQQWNVALENCDLVFLATAQSSAATGQQIDESLSSLLKRAARS